MKVGDKIKAKTYAEVPFGWVEEMLTECCGKVGTIIDCYTSSSGNTLATILFPSGSYWELVESQFVILNEELE